MMDNEEGVVVGRCILDEDFFRVLIQARDSKDGRAGRRFPETKSAAL